MKEEKSIELDLWAITENSYRAIASEDDLLPGETLKRGMPPVIDTDML